MIVGVTSGLMFHCVDQGLGDFIPVYFNIPQCNIPTDSHEEILYIEDDRPIPQKEESDETDQENDLLEGSDYSMINQEFEGHSAQTQNWQDFPCESLSSALLDERCISRNGDKVKILDGWYDPCKRLDFEKTTDETLRSLEMNTTNDIELIRSLDVDGLFGLLDHHDLSKCVRSTLKVLAVPLDCSKAERRNLKRLLNLSRDLDVETWLIVKFASLLSAQQERIFVYICINNPSRNTFSKVKDVIDSTMSFNCSQKDPDSSYHICGPSLTTLSKTNRIAHRGSRNQFSLFSDPVSPELMPCFQFLFSTYIQETLSEYQVKLMIRWVDMKAVIMSSEPRVESMVHLERLLRKNFQLEIFDPLHLDVAMQFTPDDCGLPLTILPKPSSFNTIGLLPSSSHYCLFFTQDIANSHCYSRGSIKKQNIYTNTIDVITSGGQPPIPYRNIGKNILQRILSSKRFEKGVMEELQVLARDVVEVNSRCVAASQLNLGFRMEYRVSYYNLLNLVGVLSTINLNDCLYLCKTSELMEWIRLSFIAVTQPVVAIVREIACNPSVSADIAKLKCMIGSISVLESLKSRTLWTGQQYSYSNELVWTQSLQGLDLKAKIATFNRLSFAADIWSLQEKRFIADERTSQLLTLLLKKMCGNRENNSCTYLDSIQLVFRMETLSDDIALAADWLWDSYKETIAEYLSLSNVNEALTVAVLSRAENVNFLPNPHPAEALIIKLFDSARKANRSWQLPFMYAYEVAEIRFGRARMREQLENSMARNRVEAVHYITAEARFFSSGRRFVKVQFRPSSLNPEPFFMHEVRLDLHSAARAFSKDSCREYIPWTRLEVEDLLQGLTRHGLGNWSAIKRDSQLCFKNGRRGNNALKDKYRQWEKRGVLQRGLDGTFTLAINDEGRHLLPRINQNQRIRRPSATNSAATAASGPFVIVPSLPSSTCSSISSTESSRSGRRDEASCSISPLAVQPSLSPAIQDTSSVNQLPNLSNGENTFSEMACPNEFWPDYEFDIESLPVDNDVDSIQIPSIRQLVIDCGITNIDEVCRILRKRQNSRKSFWWSELRTEMRACHRISTNVWQLLLEKLVQHNLLKKAVKSNRYRFSPL